MRAYNGYKKGTPTKEKEKLPVGGYVLKILEAEEVTFQNGGAGLKISFDIAEGEYQDFYRKDYASQQEPKKWKGNRRLGIPSDYDEDSKKDYFANQMACVEASNPGYEFDFDEKKLKGKLVGAVFGEKEYDGEYGHGFWVCCRGFRTVDAIRNGKFKVPAPQMLQNKNTGGSGSFTVDNSIDDSDIPF